MRQTLRKFRMASAAFAALATLTLGACGADDAAPDSASGSTASNTASNTSFYADAANPTNVPARNAATSPASVPLAADPLAASDDVITQTMQASLAADSQQVSPVMRYAPGDSAGSH